jgi:predicted aspartyl protease
MPTGGVQTTSAEPAYVSYGGKGIGQYSENEPWDNFVERLSGHLDACNVKNVKQRRDILMSTVGPDTYALMKNLLGEEKPRDKSYDELVDLVKAHKCPTPPWQSERIKFLNRDRKSGETVMEYMAVLKNMMATCKYSAQEYKNQLRDRLLHGCNDGEMQRAIIDVGEQLTYEDAVKAALQYEARQKSLRELGATSGEEVKALSSNCWRCGGRHSPDKCWYKNEQCHKCSRFGHVRRCCPNGANPGSKRGRKTGDQQGDRASGKPPDRRSNTPGQARNGGHRGRGRGRGHGRGRSRGRYKQNQMSDVDNDEYVYDYDYVEDEYDCDVDNKMSAVYDDDDVKGELPSMCNSVKCKSPSLCDGVKGESPSMCDGATCKSPNLRDVVADDVDFGIHVVETKVNDQIEKVHSVKPVKPYRVDMYIEGKSVQMEIDTGASRTTISESVYEAKFKHVQLRPTDVLLRSYTGDKVPILGEIFVNVEKQNCKLALLVVKGKCASLLGRDWLEKVKLNWTEIFKVTTSKSVDSLLERYSNVFVPDNKGIQGLRAQ